MQNRISFAVIGCGRWGRNHVRTLLQVEGAELRYVCDSDAAALAALPQLPSTTEKIDLPARAFEDATLDAVVVATPAVTHYQLAQQALAAGKHVLVEKPLALYVDEAEALVAQARQENRKLMVGHVLLYHPAIQKIRQLIEANELGRLQYLYSNRLNLGSIRSEENILWSFAPHDLSVLQYLIGAQPIHIDAYGGTFVQPGIQDVTLTTLAFPENVKAHIHVSWLHPFKEQRLVVIGDKNMVVFEDTRSEDKLRLCAKGFDVISGETTKREGEFTPVAFDATPPLQLELEHFCDCIANDITPRTDGLHGVAVLRMLSEAQRALENNANKVRAARTSLTKSDSQGVHPTAIVDENVTIGTGSKIWHFSHLLSGAQIGEYCSIGQNVVVGNNVRIGNQVKIQNNVSVYEGVELEDFVFCGPSMVFTNVLDPRSEFPQRGSEHYHKTLVRTGATLGANCTIVAGVTIGEYAFVGAAAVVTKDVAAYAQVVGNPAKQTGWRCRCGEKLPSAAKQDLVCSRCEQGYRQENGALIPQTA